MTNWEWLLEMGKERPDELKAWFDAERGGVAGATEHVRDATEMTDSREELEGELRETCWGNNVDRLHGMLSYCKRHGLTVSESNVTANYEGHAVMTVVEHMLDRQAAITRRTEQAEWIKQANGLIHEANARADELEAERDALRAENMSLKANSDECVPKAIKKRDEVIKILESERDEARAKCAELEAEANGLVGQIGDVEGSLLIAQGKNRELREKLSAAIGHAVEITQLQDLEGEVS